MRTSHPSTFRHIPIFAVTALLLSPIAVGQEIAGEWTFTLRKPAADWQRPGFGDTAWKQADGGFGTRDTPNARVGTAWATNNIWHRKTFPLANIPANELAKLHMALFADQPQVQAAKKATADN